MKQRNIEAIWLKIIQWWYEGNIISRKKINEDDSQWQANSKSMIQYEEMKRQWPIDNEENEK